MLLRAPWPAFAAATLALAAPSAFGQAYTYDDGTTENALSLDAAEIGFLHGFDAGAAGDAIGEVRVALGTALAPMGGLDGNPIRIVVWNDPNNDGDPADAVPLYESAPIAAIHTNSDVKVSYPVVPAVAVTGGFFVGIITEVNDGEFPVGLDLTGGFPGAPAYLFFDSVAVDPAALSGLSQQSSAVFLLDAVGGGNTSISTNYCSPAAPNSTGMPAGLTGTGSPVVALNQLTITATDLPPQSFGFFITSDTQGFVANPGGSQGNLCLGGAIGRFVGQIQSAGAAGTFSIDVDLQALPQPNGPVSVMAGETWNFQCWYRDANPAVTSNFSDAIEVAFL